MVDASLLAHKQELSEHIKKVNQTTRRRDVIFVAACLKSLTKTLPVERNATIIFAFIHTGREPKPAEV